MSNGDTVTHLLGSIDTVEVKLFYYIISSYSSANFSYSPFHRS